MYNVNNNSIGIIAKIIEESGCKSYIDHESLANILGVKFNRGTGTVKIKRGDIAYVVQYQGERLPEGETELPDSTELKLYKVLISFRKF